MGHADAGRWIGPAFLTVMGAGALWDGLYAPGQQLIAVALAALLAMAVSGRASLSRLEWAGLSLLLLGTAASLRSPASAGVAAHGPVIVAGWVLAMVAGRVLAQRDALEAERLLARFWAIVATCVAFGGMLAISFIPAHHSGRLASSLGYPIAVGMLGLLGLAGSLPDLAAGRRWAGTLLLGSGLAVLLSGSRWVWLTGVLLALYLLWASPERLRRSLRGLLTGLAVALAAALWAAPAVAAREPITLAVIILIAVLTEQLLEAFHPSRILLAVLLAAWGFTLALAPGWSWLLGRATALPLTEGSSVERLTFLQDGLRLVAELPWGAGYRGWNALHLQVASYGYYSAEVHSALVDLAIAFGWAGGLGFLLLLARFLGHLRHGRRWPPERVAVLAGLGALALHSLLDWDLSYALFAFPLWFGFGLAPPVRATAGPGSLRWPAWLTLGLAGVTLAAGALLGAGEIFTSQAEASLRGGAPETALLHAGAAVAVTPWNDLSHAYRAQAAARLGLSDQAVASLRKARALGPREPWYAQLLARELEKQERWLEAAAAWRDAVALWPWQVPVYEEALQAHVAMVQRARAAGEVEMAAQLAQSGESILAALEQQKAREPAAAPRRPMQIDTPAIRQAARFLREGLGR